MTSTDTLATTATATATPNGIARRLATVLLVLVASLGSLLALTTPASAGTYTPSMTCSSGTLDAPLIARPAQLNAFYTRVNGGPWYTAYIFSSGTESWKWSTAYGWTYVGQAGGFYGFEPGGVEAWVYTWTYNGGYQGVGWTNLGVC